MKTTFNNKLSAILVTTVVGSFLMAGSIQAQVHTRGSAKGGATKLMRVYAAEKLHAAHIERIQAMNCENCKDVLVTVRESHFKGAGTKPSFASRRTKQVLRHACPDCKTQWKVTGHGKNKLSLAQHSCTKCQ